LPIIVLHVLTSLVLIVVVLVQHGQSDMGAIFGGSSQTVFGGSGAGNFLTKFTSGLAILFMCTSLLLATKVGQGGSSSSVMSDVPPAASTTQDAVPSPTKQDASVPAKPIVVPIVPGAVKTKAAKPAAKPMAPPKPAAVPVSPMPPAGN